MSQDLNPMFKIVDYQIAVGSESAAELAAEEYEPYGEPSFVKEVVVTGGVEREVVNVYQAFVKRAPFDVVNYLGVMKSLLVMAMKLQSVSGPSDLFDHDEIMELAVKGVFSRDEIFQLYREDSINDTDIQTLVLEGILTAEDIE